MVSYIREAITERLAELKDKLDAAAKELYYYSSDGVEAEIEEPDDVDVTIDDRCQQVVDLYQNESPLTLYADLWQAPFGSVQARADWTTLQCRPVLEIARVEQSLVVVGQSHPVRAILWS
jgi:hypothetical protein